MSRSYESVTQSVTLLVVEAPIFYIPGDLKSSSRAPTKLKGSSWYKSNVGALLINNWNRVLGHMILYLKQGTTKIVLVITSAPMVFLLLLASGWIKATNHSTAVTVLILLVLIVVVVVVAAAAAAGVVVVVVVVKRVMRILRVILALMLLSLVCSNAYSSVHSPGVRSSRRRRRRPNRKHPAAPNASLRVAPKP